MGRKRKTAYSLNPEISADGSPVVVTEPETPKDTTPSRPLLAPRRLSIELNDDGSVAWNSMRENNVVEFRNLLARPEIKEEFKEKPAEIFDAGTISGALDVLGKMLTYAAVRFKKIPNDIAIEAFAFTQRDKDLVLPPALKVANKYAPAWAMKYQDEMALAFTMVLVINAKITLANSLVEARKNAPQATTVEMPKPDTVQ